MAASILFKKKDGKKEKGKRREGKEAKPHNTQEQEHANSYKFT